MRLRRILSLRRRRHLFFLPAGGVGDDFGDGAQDEEDEGEERGEEAARGEERGVLGDANGDLQDVVVDFEVEGDDGGEPFVLGEVKAADNLGDSITIEDFDGEDDFGLGEGGEEAADSFFFGSPFLFSFFFLGVFPLIPSTPISFLRLSSTLTNSTTSPDATAAALLYPRRQQWPCLRNSSLPMVTTLALSGSTLT